MFLSVSYTIINIYKISVIKPNDLNVTTLHLINTQLELCRNIHNCRVGFSYLTHLFTKFNEAKL